MECGLSDWEEVRRDLFVRESGLTLSLRFYFFNSSSNLYDLTPHELLDVDI